MSNVIQTITITDDGKVTVEQTDLTWAYQVDPIRASILSFKIRTAVNNTIYHNGGREVYPTVED